MSSYKLLSFLGPRGPLVLPLADPFVRNTFLCTSSYSDIFSCAESATEYMPEEFPGLLLGGVGWGLG